MKHIIFSFLFLICIPISANDWENNHVLQINREPARAAFMPFTFHKGDCEISLNGKWKFRWTKTPDERIVNFYSPQYNCSDWKDIDVPANWEVNGYGTPIYISSGYPFKIDPPYVMKEPKRNWTTFTERNPTGQYRRSFIISDNSLSTRRYYIRFDGVQSAFYLWINGHKVGYSQGSMEPSEFDITSYVQKGVNDISVEVYKYSDASYLEDQDFWRFGGIQRNVTIFSTPNVQLRDYAVRTVAVDADFKKFELQINPKMRVFNNETGAGYKVKAILSDEKGGDVVLLTADASDILDIDHKAANMNEWFPQRGRSKFARMSTIISNPHLWTSETPYLYNLRLQLIDSLGNVVQQTEQKLGFRDYKIKDGMLLVNGRQVRLRGVNRHEHDPKLARVMTEQGMQQDIKLMKAANINAVRTSHYPNVSRWYELCDSAGIYVMDEADCETHGLRGTLTSSPDWTEAFLDRAVRMGERDKNYTCIVFWSLGNESGFGINHATMAGWLHEFDPTRFVHYEGAQGYDGNPDPACVDIVSRFYPRVMHEYLNPGIPIGADKERAENARWERLLEIAERKNDNRPVLTSEYAHCMGNALGNFSEYWDEIYSHKRMLGGFVWDWVDQGIYSKNKDILYGGDFGDTPNLKAFCLNGVVFADRSISSKYQELKYVYSPVRFSRHGDSIFVVNRCSHLSLSAYKATFSIMENGHESKHGSLTVPDVMPGDSAVIALASKYVCHSDNDCRLNINVFDTHGNNVITYQTELHDNLVNAACKIQRERNLVRKSIKNCGFDVVPNFYRAPTDNDTGFGNWLAKDWKNNRLDSPEVCKINDEITEYRYPKGKIVVTQYGDSLRFDCKGDLPELPCIGIVIKLPSNFEQLSWYGRGPWDGYPDRKHAAIVGLWKDNVTNQYTHYPRPQDNGNHEDCSMVQLKSVDGRIFRIEADGAPFSFSALHYSDIDIATATHDYHLKPSKYTYLKINCAVLGLGNGSCGPGVLKKYSIDRTKSHTLKFRMYIR